MLKKASYPIILVLPLSFSICSCSKGSKTEFKAVDLEVERSSCGEFSSSGYIKFDAFTENMKTGRTCRIPSIEIYPLEDGEMPDKIEFSIFSAAGKYSIEEEIEKGTIFFESHATAPCAPEKEMVSITASATNGGSYSAVDTVVFREEIFEEVHEILPDGTGEVSIRSDASFVYIAEERQNNE